MFLLDSLGSSAALRFATAASTWPGTNGTAQGTQSSDSITVTQLSTVTPEAIEWLWPARIPRRKLTLLSGDAGLGKSSLALDITARVTAGLPWPGSEKRSDPEAVILLSAEDGLADTIRPRLDVMGADASKVQSIDSVKIRGRVYSFGLDRDIERLRELVRRYKAALIVIDPITAYMGNADTWKDAEVRRVLSPLAAMAESEHVAVLGIIHPSKADQQKAVHRAGGSIAFIAVPRISYLVAEDPRDSTRCLVATIKCNIAPKPPTIAYHFEPTGENKPARVVWEMVPVPITAQQLVDGVSAPSTQNGKLEEAKKFLSNLLRDGDVLVKEGERKAKEAGVSHSTLERARAALGVTAERVRGLAGDGAWKWQLPKNVKS